MPHKTNTSSKYNPHSSFIIALCASICAIILIVVGIVIRLRHSTDPTLSEYQVLITQATSDTIQGIHYEYGIEDHIITSGDVTNASRVDLKPGDAIYLNFNSSMLPEGTDPKDAVIRIYIIDKYGNRSLVSPVLSFAPEYGQTYNYELEGSAPYYRLTRK